MQQDKVAFYFRENILKKFPKELQKSVAVAGGAVRDKLLDLDIKDYDLFVDSKSTEDSLMKFLSEKGKATHINSQTANYTFEGKWLQVVRNKYYSMDNTSVIDSFDFVHCCAMVTMDKFHTHSDFYKAVATKHIMVNKLSFPLNSLERMQKYILKGYKACNGTLFALSSAINAMDKSIFDLSKEVQTEDTKIKDNSLLFYSDGSPRFVGVD